MAKTVYFSARQYSDVALVEGVAKHNPVVERALYDHCKEYFEDKYRAVFFIGGEHREDIFQNSFIKLWENIENKKIYVEDGVLKGKGGQPFTSSLTTYFMGIARMKYKEWARENPIGISTETTILSTQADSQYNDSENVMLEIISDCISHMPERCCQILTMFWYEMKSLDDIMKSLASYKSKDALKTEKYKCMTRLGKTANDLYQHYLNAN